MVKPCYHGFYKLKLRYCEDWSYVVAKCSYVVIEVTGVSGVKGAQKVSVQNSYFDLVL